MLFGKKGLMKRGALLWAIIVGTIFYAIFGHIDFSSVAQAKLVGLPKIMPYGFGVNVGVVILMLLAYLHSVSEALGMYSLIAGWDGQQVDEHRANGGIFGLAVGNIVGTLVGGCRTDFADIQNKKECGGNRQWQNHYLRNWAANTKGKGII